MYGKRLKLSHHSPFGLQEEEFDAHNAPESWLCVLPTEVLNIIFSYLPPQSVVAITELGVTRLTEIILSLKVADFSSYSTVHNEDVISFFSKDRLQVIRELNFNGLFFVKPLTLENCIVKCQNLRILSAADCGLSWVNIRRILHKCRNLEELYWTVCSKRVKGNFDDDVFRSVKKIYLNVKLPKNIDYELISKILQLCPIATDVCLNFSPYFTRTLPPPATKDTFSGKIFFKARDHPVNVVFASQIPDCLYEVRNIMTGLSNELSINDVFVDGEDLPYFLTNYSSHLQFLTEKKTLSELPLLPDNSVHSLVVIMTEDKELLMDHMENIKRMTGPRLKNLLLHSTTKPSNLDRNVDIKIRSHLPLLRYLRGLGDEKEEDSEELFVCNILKHIISNSCNITVLNLSRLHYDVPFPFSALCHLKKLKVLSLSSCTLEQHPYSHESSFKHQGREFELMVENCTVVEVFSLYGCVHCSFGASDVDLAAISKWKRLRSLTLSHLHSLRTCPFLIHVSNNCPHLMSLELIAIGEETVCHYTPNVIHILKKSKKLAFLRINQPAFYPMSSFFWKAIESAENLQGLCIASASDTAIENKVIMDVLKKMPFLHLFHLHGLLFRICQNLEKQIKQVMTKKEFQDYNIGVRIIGLGGNAHIKCGLSHFLKYHEC